MSLSEPVNPVSSRTPDERTGESISARAPLDWRLLLVAFLIGAAVVLARRPWRQLETGDEAIWDYVAQSILRGQIPYRDVIEIKTPLSAYLSAAAIAAGRL